MENRWPPERVNSLVTPAALSRRATRRPPWTLVPSSMSVDMRGRTLALDGKRTRRCRGVLAHDLGPALPAGATPAGRSAATVGGTPAGFADVEHLRSPCQTPGVHVNPQRGQTPLRVVEGCNPQRGQTPLRVVEGLGRDAPSRARG